jgi:hypothetical protein
MHRLAIGPAWDYPSWRWVGADTAHELARYFDVSQFSSFRHILPCDAVIIIKHRPPTKVVRSLRERGVSVVFAPIDLYASHAEIHRDREFLAGCDLVLCHSELLFQCIRPYCARVALVEHHGKYTLPSLASYKPDGYVLWIGGLQHVPYLLDWLARHPVRRNLKILTDFGNREAVRTAARAARHLGLRLDIGPDSINGYEMRAWSEAEQLQMMQECKAAIDIKGDDFNQLSKPPTKAQKFISSGIAFACNFETPASCYFRERGFELACPADEDLWFSPSYWQQTCHFATDLRERISIESVGLRYQAELQSLLTATSA